MVYLPLYVLYDFWIPMNIEYSCTALRVNNKPSIPRTTKTQENKNTKINFCEK